eukprot:2671554-Pyramimonas_sp.AAC.1
MTSIETHPVQVFSKPNGNHPSSGLRDRLSMGFRAVRFKSRPGHQLVHDGTRSAIKCFPPLPSPSLAQGKRPR